MRYDPDTRAAGRAAAKKLLIAIAVFLVLLAVWVMYSFTTMPPGGFG